MRIWHPALPQPKTEAELCSRFVDRARGEGWTCYPETAGWDLVLTRAGIQVGIQAKLRANVKVLYQALPSARRLEPEQLPGPDYRAVLVPDHDDEFYQVCVHLGLTLWSLWEIEWVDRGELEREALGWSRRPATHHELERSAINARGTPWPYSAQLELPDFVPNLAAGVPSPVTMSPWRIRAIKLCRLLRERGYLTIYDFRREGLSPTLWIHRWLKWDGSFEMGQSGRNVRRYVRRAEVMLPDETTDGCIDPELCK